MTHRNLLALLVLASACSGGRLETDDNAQTETEAVEAEDTAQVPVPDKRARSVRISAAFAWDADLGEVVQSVNDAEMGLLSAFMLTFFEGADQTGESCEMIFDWVGNEPVDPTGSFEIASFDNPYHDNRWNLCQEGWDYAQLGESSPWYVDDWVLTVTGDELPELVEQQLRAAAEGDPDVEIDKFSSGSASNSRLLPAVGEANGFWQVYEMDEDHIVIDQLMHRDRVPTGDGIASGYYVYEEVVFHVIDPDLN